MHREHRPCSPIPRHPTPRPRTGTRRRFGPRPIVALLVLGLGFLGSQTAVRALDPTRAVSQYGHRQWRLEEGLPQNTVRAVAQDRNGLLWVGTHGGLVRFDGVTFERIDGPDYDFLDRYHVYNLAAAIDGSLWISTAGGGLFRRRADGRTAPFSLTDALPSRQIAALATDGHRLWIGTEDAGLALFEDGELHTWGPGQGLPPGSINGLAPDGRGGCWVATLGNGLHHVSESGIRTFGTEHGLPSRMVRSVLVAPDGRVWVGTDHGLAVGSDDQWRTVARTAHPTTGTVRARNSDPGGEAEAPPLRARSLVLDLHGNLWIGTLGQGLWRWGPRGLEPLRIESEPSRETVWCVFADREGHIWYGSLGGGLHQVFDGPGTPFGEPEGLIEQRPLALDEGPEGHLVITTRSSGLQRLSPGAPANAPSERLGVVDGLSSPGSWSLDHAADGTLWVASMAPGVDRILPDGRVQHFDVSDGLGAGRVVSVRVLADGTIWAATASGVSRFDGERFETFGVEEGVIHAQTLHLVEGPGQHLWIGTNGGISIFRGGRFTTHIGEAEGLRSPRIWTILPTGDDDGWAGTFGGGLHGIVDGRAVLVVNQDDGLPNNDITALVDDGRGFLWVGTTAGVARLPWEPLRTRLARALGTSPPKGENATSPIPLDIETFDARNGLRSAELYGGQPNGIRDRQGRIWFTTLDGLVSFDPARLENPAPPRVLLRALRLDGRSVPVTESLVLEPDIETLEIDYTAASLRAPTRTEFRYRLVGIDDDWRALGSRRTISLARLPPGDYRFEVEASDARGRFVGIPATISLRVEPHFVETPAFYALAALTLVGLGLLVGQWRVRFARAREQDLARAVAEAVASVRTLRGMLPICASCKNIRDDDGYWQKIESYLDDNSEARFSHGLCPDCMDKYMSEVEAAENAPVESFETVILEPQTRPRGRR